MGIVREFSGLGQVTGVRIAGLSLEDTGRAALFDHGATMLKVNLLTLALLVPLCPAPAQSADETWIVVTLGREGWGVGENFAQSQAIAGAIAECRAMKGTECGAEFTAIRAGWTLGFRCGDYRFIVAEKTLAEAEQTARDREMDLAVRYVPHLPACKRVLSVAPSGEVKSPELEISRGSR